MSEKEEAIVTITPEAFVTIYAHALRDMAPTIMCIQDMGEVEAKEYIDTLETMSGEIALEIWNNGDLPSLGFDRDHSIALYALAVEHLGIACRQIKEGGGSLYFTVCTCTFKAEQAAAKVLDSGLGKEASGTKTEAAGYTSLDEVPKYLN